MGVWEQAGWDPGREAGPFTRKRSAGSGLDRCSPVCRTGCPIAPVSSVYLVSNNNATLFICLSADLASALPPLLYDFSHNNMYSDIEIPNNNTCLECNLRFDSPH
jgi:hypothetical protein